jgi:cytochrome c7-like protein
MHWRLTTAVLATALAVSLVTLGAAWHLPGDNQGYQPVQPIEFSHRLHAGDMRISCFYCHSGAESSRYAGIPSVNVCMNCHMSVTVSPSAVQREEQRARQEKRAPNPPTESAELRKLYDALALDETLAPIDGKTPKPIAWRRVHTLPQFVYFDHRAHIAAQVACQRCHGPVETMDRVRQVETLAMGWCVNCHRDVNTTGVAGRPVHASTDCVTCHY